jgi:hypothetical protein
LVKFDFGYELPPLQQGAPWRMDDAGERLLFKALEVVVGAMREVDPDLVVMYYGLSPFLGPWVDLHSPDDLWLCPGDYALEANRRFFFSGLLGELGIPTLGSTGYDWASAPSIWFDAAPVGTLGSLQSFAGDEIDSAPTPLRVAKYNGLVHLLRPSPEFTVMPLDPPSNSAIFGANASSWARLERGQPVMVALRDRRWDGAPGPGGFGGWLTSDTSVVIASATDEPIPAASRLGIVPFGNGRLVLRRQDPASAARAREFRFDGTTRQWRLPIRAGKLEVPLAERAPNGAAVEWIELDFSRGAPPPGSPRSGNR